ncbi:hypothetical protein TCAL_00652 [Tigriopus californicus]|uniref:Large ribosomal subunit protein uL24 C-terminal domain-containing protein n=1 Tax=Tigriopus californicus TaxID=6832 RepID=A0A553PAT2_TIGCA|nr:large ribosomal subunit protein uL24m-like [Tigriopus californicus]TRY74790.1 hypothetical protein TCAL_00652 [Tigriopus californicus]|eukprot:TCALIF_00652-PA protein Name:"Similar to mRpL24 Probable 39S ribosomal protein L24, mitochondrial (Drosophila pseudoobscura pseudoobscura)" AED:0.00 eAED:0.01 QI:0/-1/0/1/-1/1/1/0/265
MRLLPMHWARRGAGDGLDSGFMTWSKVYANLPERYMMRKAYKLKYKPPVAHPAFKQAIETSRIPEFTMDRPWSAAYWEQHEPHAPVQNNYVEPILDEDWMWFKGDRVQILVGPDKGKQGYINYVVQEKNWVCVEGLNCKYEMMGESRNFPGMMIMREKPLVVTTDIQLVDPSDETPAQVEWRFSEDGERVRTSTRTGHILPIPSAAFETQDYKTPVGYRENQRTDTPASLVQEITFEPKLCTFEMDIMESEGIVETRNPPRTYWY